MQRQNLTCDTAEIRINIKDSFELRYRTNEFEVTKYELSSAVEAAGYSLAYVKGVIQKNMPKTR